MRRKASSAKRFAAAPAFMSRRAAAVHPVALDLARKWRVRPHVVQTLGDHVEMRLQDQRAARLATRAVDADDDGRVRMILGYFRTTGMGGNRLVVHLEPVHGIAATLQLTEQEILKTVFVPAQ